jgi:hypothetical protein
VSAGAEVVFRREWGRAVAVVTRLAGGDLMTLLIDSASVPDRGS